MVSGNLFPKPNMRHNSILLLASMAAASMSPGFSERIMTATPPRPRRYPGPMPKTEILPNQAMVEAQVRREARAAKKAALVAQSKAGNYHQK